MTGFSRHRETDEIIVSRCLETPVKHEARVSDMPSRTIRTSLVIRGYCFSALISHELMYLKNNQNVGILLVFVVSHVVVKMAVFCSEYRKPFSFSKNWRRKTKVASREHS